MPFSIVHIELWVGLKDNFKNNDNLLDFLAWSIFVDSSYELNNQWVFISRDVTHYHNGQDYSTADFSKNFLECELKNNFSYFNLWYYCHLTLDKLWRDSKFIQNAYNNVELDNIYQLSRVFHSFLDLNNFLKVDKLSYITQLYNYKIEKSKIPSMFHNIDTHKLQSSFLSILDYMTLKKVFNKVENEDKIYNIIDWKFNFLDKKIEKKINELFPHEDYNKLKEYSLGILLQDIQNFKQIL